MDVTDTNKNREKYKSDFLPEVNQKKRTLWWKEDNCLRLNKPLEYERVTKIEEDLDES